MRVYDVVARTLEALGANPLFGVIGDVNMRYIAAFRERGGRYVAAAHEAGAVAMADGFFRLSGRVGFVTVTHGPGVTNALTAITEAARSHSSLVVVTGTTPRQAFHKQWLDLRSAAQLVGAAYRSLQTADDIAGGIAAAARDAKILHRPVIVDISASLVGEETDAVEVPSAAWTSPRIMPEAEDLDETLGVIASASRPLILAGRGVVAADARDEALALADALAAPIANTVMAMNLADGHPANLGIFGSESHSLAIRRISEADCLIVLGAGLNEFTTANGDLLKNTTIVRVDNDPRRAAEADPTWISVTADVKLFAAHVAQVLREVGEWQSRQWTAGIVDELTTFDPNDDFVDMSDDEFIDLRTAMVELDARLPVARAVVTDVGRFKTAPWRHLSCSPAAFTQPGGYGAIGLGLATAIGGAFARPDIPMVAVVGDGGLMMSIAEFATIAEHQLPIVVAIANDGSYGAEWEKLGSYGQAPQIALRTWPSFADIALGFGLESHVIAGRADIARLEAQISEITAPVVLDIRTDPAVNNRIYK